MFTQLLILNYFYYTVHPVSVTGSETRPTPAPTSRTVQQQKSNNCIRENNVYYNVRMTPARASSAGLALTANIVITININYATCDTCRAKGEPLILPTLRSTAVRLTKY